MAGAGNLHWNAVESTTFFQFNSNPLTNFTSNLFFAATTLTSIGIRPHFRLLQTSFFRLWDWCSRVSGRTCLLSDLLVFWNTSILDHHCRYGKVLYGTDEQNIYRDHKVQVSSEEKIQEMEIWEDQKVSSMWLLFHNTKHFQRIHESRSSDHRRRRGWSGRVPVDTFGTCPVRGSALSARHRNTPSLHRPELLDDFLGWELEYDWWVLLCHDECSDNWIRRWTTTHLMFAQRVFRSGASKRDLRSSDSFYHPRRSSFDDYLCRRCRRLLHRQIALLRKKIRWCKQVIHRLIIRIHFQDPLSWLKEVQQRRIEAMKKEAMRKLFETVTALHHIRLTAFKQLTQNYDDHLRSKAPDPPRNLLASHATADSVMLRWSAPIYVDEGKRYWYTITYKPRTPQRRNNVVAVDFINKDRYLVTGLKSFTLYEFSVYVTTRYGQSVPIKVQEYTGKLVILKATRNVTLTFRAVHSSAVRQNRCHIRWDCDYLLESSKNEQWSGVVRNPVRTRASSAVRLLEQVPSRLIDTIHTDWSPCRYQVSMTK